MCMSVTTEIEAKLPDGKRVTFESFFFNYMFKENKNHVYICRMHNTIFSSSFTVSFFI